MSVSADRDVGAAGPRPRWLPLSLCVAVVGGVAVLLAYYWRLVLLTDLYRNIIPGIWLTLARDLRDGLFYRPLVSEAGYGGTRYFPLHFSVIAGFMRAGAGPQGAWLLSNAVSSAVLVSGVYAAVRLVSVPRATALVFAACGFAPYFIQQSLFELRCDVLAAGLNVWGLALLIRAWETDDPHARTWPAGACFTLAFATKITSLGVPVAAVLALALSGRLKRAGRLAAVVAVGASLVVSTTEVLSQGRAAESWTATMFAGVGAGGTIASLTNGDFAERFFYSRFLSALFALVLAAGSAVLWFLGRGALVRNRRLAWLPALALLAASVVTVVTLSSPGAVAANQTIEWLEVALVSLAVATRLAPVLARPVSLAVAALALWGAAQDAVQVRAYANGVPDSLDSAAVREEVVARLASTQGPVLSESALWPILADRPVEIMDAFMFRILADTRPSIGSHLANRIARGEFDVIVLASDPTTPRGRLWFSGVDLGQHIIDQITANYRLDRRVASDVWFYVRRRDP